MPSTVVIILVIFALLLFGGFGYFIYCDISLQKIQKAEKDSVFLGKVWD